MSSIDGYSRSFYLQTTDDDLRRKFDKFGPLTDVYLPKDPGSGFVCCHATLTMMMADNNNNGLLNLLT